MKIVSITRSMAMLSVAGLLPAAFAVTVSVEQLALEQEAVQLIRQVEEVGRDVRYNAGRLNSIAVNPQINRWTHAHHLSQIKHLMNDGLRPAITRLTAIQPMLPEWKQDAIDKLLNAARALAADTSSAIWTKNESGSAPLAMNADYKNLVAKIYEHSEMLVKTSDAAGNFAAARLKAADADLRVAHR